jgi:poly(3-hydroxybutyrate) depolymerase
MKPLAYLAIVMFSFALSTSTRASTALPAMGASAEGTSVSGLSSGAFMAVQYQVAYSASVIGAGVVAGGPYYCAAGLIYANPANIGSCMGMPLTLPLYTNWMVVATQGFAAAGDIDPTANLKKRRIYVFSGTNDKVVYPPAVNSTVAFFKRMGVAGTNLVYVHNIPSGHALITPAFGNSCAINDKPYISRCTVNTRSYDQPGAILAHIYGTLNPPVTTRTGQLLTFNQREFADASTNMADDAFAYVPASCASGAGCKVHVAFHGCLQSEKYVHDDFYGKTSYNDWADSNNMIVLYPQVNDSQPLNPNGCWDWVGYTGAAYAFRNGTQMKAVNAMVNRLTSAPSATIAMH